MKNKSVLEQALLEAQQLEEAVKSNAKEILASTMKQEIEDLVKESLNEQDGEIDFDEVEQEDLEDEVSGLPNEEEAMVSIEVDADEPLDLTGASDGEVLKVFKAMGAEDGIVVTQDDDVVELEDQEAGTEYKIELAENKLKNYPFIKEGVGDLKEDDMNPTDVDLESEVIEPEGEGSLEEALYEIELEEADEGGGPNKGAKYFDEGGKRFTKGPYGKKERETFEADQGGGPNKGAKYFDEGGKRFTKGPYGKKEEETYEADQGGGPNKGAKYFDEGGKRFTKGPYGKKEEMAEQFQDYDPEMPSAEFPFAIFNSLDKYLDWCKQEGTEDCDENGYKWDAYLAYRSMGPHGKKVEPFIKKILGNDLVAMKQAFDNEGNNPLENVASEEQEMDEASRTYGFGSKKGRGLRKAFTPNRNKVYKESIKTKRTINEIVKISKQLQTENRKYKEKNKDYREALKVFRGKLNEVAVFNANLAYSTKLFTDFTTTKKEKINILRRFDNVSTLNESKSLFKQIAGNLDSEVQSLKESVQKTITKTPLGGSSINLIETKTYENPQITRMKEIMSKL